MVSEFCGVLRNGFAVRFEHVFHIFKSGFQHRDEEVDVVMRRVSMALRFSFTRAKILKTAHDPVRAFVVGSISPCVGHSFHYCRPVSSTSTAAAIVHLPTEDHPSRKPESKPTAVRWFQQSRAQQAVTPADNPRRHREVMFAG